MSADCFYGGVLIKLTVTVHGDIDLSVTNNFIFRNSNVSHKKIHKEIRRSVVCIYWKSSWPHDGLWKRAANVIDLEPEVMQILFRDFFKLK